ncbi:hypothetical protein [Amphibacillus cookii]|uniref:hypothetical protein n=1 Tax=Amphibacillus cookii TaxID=767787 RepID=UPI001956E778|nr:hypothetical protein [Amphibacillus cookii]MBM7541787.1 Tfp pilus assembly protein PilN [Amphibacillus cookii]
MIEINFFEKKKKNLIPYLLIGLFLVGLMITSGYLTLASIQLNKQYEITHNLIQEQSIIINDLQHVNLLANQVDQLASDLDNLVDNKHPTVFLNDDILQQLPDNPATVIIDFRYTIQGDLLLELQLTDANAVSTLTRDLQALAYITAVELEAMELVNEIEANYQVNLTISIDHVKLSEVAMDDH